MSAVRSFLAGFWAAPALAAVLLWAAFAPLDLGWPAAAAAWMVLYASFHVRGGVKAGRQAFVANLVFLMSSLSWIRPLDPASWIFVCLWCAAIEGLHARFLRGAIGHAARTGSLQWIGAAALSRLFADMVRTTLATGFPWHLLGYSAWKSGALPLAAVLGVHGFTLLITLLAAGGAEMVRRRLSDAAVTPSRPVSPRRAAAPFLPFAATLGGLAAVWLATDPQTPERASKIDVLVLQANIAQANKERLLREGGQRASVDLFWSVPERLAAEHFAGPGKDRPRPDLVIWPETMIPPYILRPFVRGAVPDGTIHTDRGFQRDTAGTTARRVARASRGAATLGGVVTLDTAGKDLVSYNSAILLDGEGRILGWQDKRHLTPGGEYLPIVDLLPWRDAIREWYVAKFGMIADLTPADGVHLLEIPAADRGGSEPSPRPKAGVLVCYESLFPELSRDLTAEGADFLVNVANYGWFAGTAQMEQALAHAAFRAAECGRTFVLASNNGVSAVFDRRGALVTATAADRDAALLAEVRMDVPSDRRGGPFLRFGETLVWILGGAGLGWALLLARGGSPGGETEEKAQETS